MTKVLLAVVVVLIALLVAGVGFILKKPQEKTEGGLKIITPTQGTPETTGAPEEKPETPATQETAKTYNIKIEDFAYSPSELKIKKGDKIVWTNKDSSRHTITSDTGKELDSELLDKENTYSHTFNTAGIFSYHCKPHPYMKAKIIVE